MDEPDDDPPDDEDHDNCRHAGTPSASRGNCFGRRGLAESPAQVQEPAFDDLVNAKSKV
jgi:hypothetical protein